MITPIWPAEAEKATFVVCPLVEQMPPTPTGDDPWSTWCRAVRARSEIVPCSGCGRPVICDSISPKTPPRICIPCMVDVAEHEGKPTDG